MAPVHYAAARAQVNAHFGVACVDELTVDQVREAIRYVQSKIDALPPAPTGAISGGELLSTHTPTALPEISPDDISPQTWSQMHKDWFCELTDIEQKLERLVTMVGFWGCPGARLLNMSPEKDILFTNASNTFRLALHGIAIARAGIANAAQVCANVDFLCHDRRR